MEGRQDRESKHDWKRGTGEKATLTKWVVAGLTSLRATITHMMTWGLG